MVCLEDVFRLVGMSLGLDGNKHPGWVCGIKDSGGSHFSGAWAFCSAAAHHGHVSWFSCAAAPAPRVRLALGVNAE